MMLLVRKLGNGGSIKFWTDVWIENVSLRKLLPRLFKVSLQPSQTIKGGGKSLDGGGMYSAKTTYFYHFEKFLSTHSMGREHLGGLENVWLSWVPSKVIVFIFMASIFWSATKEIIESIA
jgi:hypothetical protein